MVQECLEIETNRHIIGHDAKRVASVADKFRKKHGVADVKKYYTRFDAAVELSLP